MQMKKYVDIHLILTCLSELLSNGLSHSNKDFLLNNRILQVTLNEAKIKSEMEYYQKKVIIAYFVGEKQELKSM